MYSEPDQYESVFVSSATYRDVREPVAGKLDAVAAITTPPTVTEIKPLTTLTPLPAITAPAAVVVASGSRAGAIVPVARSPASVDPAALHAPSPRRNVVADAVPELPSWAIDTEPVRPETLVTGPYFADSTAKSEMVAAVCVPV
jgi:hypothetical protein